MPHPGSPTNSAGALVVLSASRSFFSLIAFSVLPSVTKIGSCGDFSREPSLIADDTVERSFCNAMGFSRKEYAPMRVASTAVSIVPCPDIMMTGIVIRPVDDHSLSRVTPSTSGIHISKSTRSGLFFENDSLACVALSAVTTWWPSSFKISESSSLMPISSSTTNILLIRKPLPFSRYLNRSD